MMTFAIAALALLLQDPVAEEACADLKAWYANRKLPSPYRKPLKELNSPDAPRRAWAGEYLVALFKQTVYDERHGLTPERRGWKMGGGPQDDAAEMRHYAAQALVDTPLSGDGRDALAAALWLLREDPYGPNQVPAMRTLARIQTADASAALKEAVLQPHPSFQVLAAAIRESARRQLPGLDDAIRRFANHYHSAVRKEARAALAILKLGDVPEVKPGERLTPSLEKGLRNLAQLPFEAIPAGAPWKWVSCESGSGERLIESLLGRESQGWLVKTTDTELHVLTLRGDFWILPKDKTKVEDRAFADLAAHVIDLRAKLEKDKDLAAEEELNSLLGNAHFMDMQGDKEPTLAEGLLAAWALARGDRDTAAGLIAPLLEICQHEGALLDGFRDLVAVEIDERMLRAFCGRRFDDALALARHISKPAFNGWENQPRAKDLAEQIPRRMGVDFKTLTLPTRAEWDAESKSFTREGRIKKLVERLRLIHAVQNSIPGGVSFWTEQSRRDKDAWIDVINPFVELYKMNLSALELLLLWPALESPDFFYAYDLERFIPNNPIDLYRVRWIAEALINTVATKDVIEHGILEGGDPARLKEHLAKAAAWCAKEGARTLGDRLEREIALSHDWEEVTSGIWVLNGLDPAALARAIPARMMKHTENRSQLYMVASRVGASREVVEFAHGDLARDITGWASLVVAKYGYPSLKKKGLASLLMTLREGWEITLQNEAVDLLLESGEPEAERELLRILTPESKVRPTMIVLQRLFLRGRPEARDFLLDLLAGSPTRSAYKAEPWSSGTYDEVKSAWSAYAELKDWSDELKWPPEMRTMSDEVRDKALREAGQAWVNATFEKIRKGEKVEIKKLQPAPPFQSWSGHGRWIRRL